MQNLKIKPVPNLQKKYTSCCLNCFTQMTKFTPWFEVPDPEVKSTNFYFGADFH